MKPLFFFSLLILSAASVNAQLTDDFSDNDFSSNPEWLGDTDLFTVSSGILQLNDPEPESTNTAFLYVPAATATTANTEWRFSVRLDFAPSASNFARVYLAASAPDLTADQEGYFLQIGGIAGSGDALELYRQDGTDGTLLISGSAGAAGQEPVIASVRILRSTSGEWELLADYSGGTNYELEGTATDATYPLGSYFGFYCRYSSTRNDRFFFDDILIDPLFVDDIPPALLLAQAISPLQVRVKFDESLDEISATNTASYQISNGIGEPTEAVLDELDPTAALIELATPLQNLQSYELTVVGIADENGNAGDSQTVEFTFFDIREAEPGDVVISEIMADPNPPVGLPDAEYVEIFNRSDKVIAVENFGFSSGTGPQLLPEKLLLPGAYLILCDEEEATSFSAFGEVAALPSFPALTNSGDEVVITSAAGTVIDALSYSAAWYRDETKESGGWSLELIDPAAPRICSGNWAASLSPAGGTPGQPNAIAGSPADQQPPRLTRATPISDQEVVLFFDEPLDAATAGSTGIYRIDNGIAIMEAFPQNPRNDEVLLFLETPLLPGTIYTVTVQPGLNDCLGNSTADTQQTTFGLPEPLLPNDLVINEILTNPETGGKDFLEVYNRSAKVLNINGLSIINDDRSAGSNTVTFDQDFLLFPGQYIVFTEDPADINSRYTVLNPQQLIEIDLPTFEDNTGNVTLRRQGVTIDSFDYSESLHNELLDDQNGVSLERIDPNADTHSAGNWHSAASTVGSATPTYENSQFFSTPALIPEIISLPRTTFSPDGDGFEDFLAVRYTTDQPGYVLNIRIYDASGRLVRKLVSNELLAASGSFKWDGSTIEGAKARIGIYILGIELFTADGRVEKSKETCVVAGKLD